MPSTTFLLLLHIVDTILFAGLLFLMDVNLSVRGTERTVSDMSPVVLIPPFLPTISACPGGKRTAGPVKAAALDQVNATHDTTPGHG